MSSSILCFGPLEVFIADESSWLCTRCGWMGWPRMDVVADSGLITAIYAHPQRSHGDAEPLARALDKDAGASKDAAEHQELEVDRDVGLLPRLFRIEAGAIMCSTCRRRWRAPAGGRISQANFEHLVQHALDHRPLTRRALPPDLAG